jgi:hypothetical protein
MLDTEDPQLESSPNDDLAESKAPCVHQQTDHDDLNATFDSHMSSTSGLCFTQDRVCFESPSIVSNATESQQRSQRKDCTNTTSTTTLYNEGQEMHSPIFEDQLTLSFHEKPE